MPPKRGKKPPSKRVFQPLPERSCWIENDAYDRRVYGYLRLESPSLRELEETGSTFLPHFASLLQDIFCLLFKYNIIFLSLIHISEPTETPEHLVCRLLLEKK